MAEPLTQFHLFKKLPTELRVKIWKLHFPKTGPDKSFVPIRFDKAKNQYTTTVAPCILLGICRESRSIFLETYRKLTLSPKHDSTIFVDFKYDTLFFDSIDCSPGGDLAYDIAMSPCRDEIQRVAFDAELWEILRVFKDQCLSEVRSMSGLKSIAIVKARPTVAERAEGRVITPEILQNIHSEFQNLRWIVDTLIEAIRTEIEAWKDSPPRVLMWTTR